MVLNGISIYILSMYNSHFWCLSTINASILEVVKLLKWPSYWLNDILNNLSWLINIAVCQTFLTRALLNYINMTFRNNTSWNNIELIIVKVSLIVIEYLSNVHACINKWRQIKIYVRKWFIIDKNLKTICISSP